MTCNDCRDAISPYLDGELSPAESDDVKAHIGACVDCASRERALRAVKDELRTLPAFAAPDVLKARLRSERLMLPTPRRRRPFAAFIAVASAAALLIGYVGYTRSRSAELDDVLARHLHSLSTGHLTQVVSTDQHNVKPWFNGRVDVSPPVVTLDSFRLVGGRVDTVRGRPVAVVVYGRRLHTINVFAWPVAGPNLDLSTTDQNGFHLLRTRRQGVELWIVSDLNRAELLDFAERLLRDY